MKTNKKDQAQGIFIFVLAILLYFGIRTYVFWAAGVQ